MEFQIEKCLITTPVYEVGRDVAVTGRQLPSMTYISSQLVPGSNVYVEFSWIWDVPNPNPLFTEHSHDYDQIGLHIGSDPKNPEDLGAEYEGVVSGEHFTTDRTNALYLPKGTKHGPFVWKRVDKPVLEMTIILGTGSHEAAKVGGFK